MTVLLGRMIIFPAGVLADSDRVGIYEVVKITKPIASAIMDGANSLELDQVAREAGFDDLRRSALKKCAQGLISLEEVSRVTTD